MVLDYDYLQKMEIGFNVLNKYHEGQFDHVRYKNRARNVPVQYCVHVGASSDQESIPTHLKDYKGKDYRVDE